MCVKPLTIPNPKKDFNPVYDKQYITVPCGHCWQCVQAKQRDLETRAVSEFLRIKKMNGCVYCYSLTYDDLHVPTYCGVNSLCGTDIQLFKKRLKKRFGSVGSHLDIFYCGELGHEHDRPHWHIIIFCDWFVDPITMADNVISAWQQGIVGFCEPYINGVRLRNDPRGSLIDNIAAIRYTMKYCFKSYNFESYIYKCLREWLMENKGFQPGVDDPEQIDYFYDDKLKKKYVVPRFEFPDDPRFRFSKKKKLTLKYLVRKLGHCFHCPVHFGEHQLKLIDDHYNMNVFLSEHSTATEKYHLSKYLRHKLFTQYYDQDGNALPYYKEGCVSRKTRYWYDYHMKMDDDFIRTQVDKIVANLHVETPHVCNGHFAFVFEALEHCMDIAPCFDSGGYRNFLTNFFKFRNTHYGLPDLMDFSKKILYKLLLKRPVSFHHRTPDLATLRTFEQCQRVDDIITEIMSELTYYTYKKNTDKYNDRQRLLSYQFGTEPKFHDVLPYEKFQNLKKMSIQDVKANY